MLCHITVTSPSYETWYKVRAANPTEDTEMPNTGIPALFPACFFKANK